MLKEMRNLNQSKKTMSKFIPLFITFIIVFASFLLFVQTANHDIAIPFSNVEKIVQQQHGKRVAITEQSDGTVYIKTGNKEYVSSVPPNSQMVDKLVEKYNIDYSYSESSRYGLTKTASL